MLTHILAAPAPGKSVEEVATAIASATGLQALTETQLKKMSEHWLIYYSPIPFVVGVLVFVGFLVGIGVSGQTFYSFVLENT
jgi:putative ABC transport system permease protein